MRIVILHFQPLEKYPPILNLIRDLERERIEKVSVLSTNTANNWFKSSIALHRWCNIGSSKWTRYTTYIIFNLFALCYLLIKRPTKVFYYETLSCWPLFWYKKIRSNIKVFIHFHEYSSEEEKNRSSSFYKNLLSKEAYLLQQAEWVSQTNEDRMRLFRIDYTFLQDKQCHIFPNYPPADWQNLAQINRTSRLPTSYKKIIYIGALGIKSTYIEVFAKWVHQQNGAYYFDIFSDNIEKEVLEMITSLKSPFISIKQPINYFDLPSTLANYDIGVVLYTGHIPNYVYNVPNKVFEYLVCGLEVWYSADLFSTKKLHELKKIESMKRLSFKDSLTFDENIGVFQPIYYSFEYGGKIKNLLQELTIQ